MGLVALAAGAAVGLAPGLASAQVGNQDNEDRQLSTERGLSAGELRAIRDAAARDDVVVIHAVVIAAIARDSSRTAAIVGDAVRAAPDYADSIVSSVASAFPTFAERVRKAAEAAARDEERPAEEAPTRPPPGRPEPPAMADPGEIEAPTAQWSGETSLGGTYQEAATDTAAAGIGTEIVRTAGPWEHTGTFVFDYGRIEDKTRTHRLSIKGKTRRDISDRLFTLGILDYENDRFSGFDYQISESVGLGYALVEQPTFTLDIEGGPTLRQSRVEETNEHINELLARLAFNLNWQISDTAGFTNETAILVGEDSIDVENSFGAFIPDSSQTRNISALDFDIIGNLSARLSCEVRYRSDPPPGGDHTSSLGKISLIHSF